MRHAMGVVALSLALLLAGCMQLLSSPASVEDDARAKAFTMEPGKASLYIVRRGGIYTDIMAIAVNGHALGRMLTNTYFHLSLMPGQYLVESEAVNDSRFVLPISLEAGKQYFVLQEGQGNQSSRDWNRLSLVSESAGRTDVLASTLIALPADYHEALPLVSNPSAAVFPLSIGIYYPPDFIGATVKEHRSVGLFSAVESVAIPIGVASRWSLDRALQNTFLLVVDLPEWPPSENAARGLDLLLVPGSIKGSRRSPTDSGPTIDFAVRVLLPDGKEISTLSASGFAFAAPNLLMIHPLNRSEASFIDNNVGKQWSKAMDGAAGQIVTALSKMPEVAARGTINLAPHAAVSTGTKPVKAVNARHIEGLAIVPLLDSPRFKNETAKLQGCLEQTLGAGSDQFQIVSAASVRNAAYPWLEAGNTPDPSRLVKFLGWPPIAKELERIEVRFVLFPTINFVDNFTGPFLCGAGAGGAGCLGVAGGEQVTKFTVSIWDVSSGMLITDPIVGETKDFSWAIGYVIPIWHSADTISGACLEIAKQFRARTGH